MLRRLGRRGAAGAALAYRCGVPTAGRSEALPALIRPMLAVPGPLPEEDAAYGYELKWDGVRGVAYVHGGRLRLMSRNDRDITASYPELAELPGLLDDLPAVLDGELVAYDPAGRPSFGALQERMHVRAPAPRLVAATPVSYHVFDVLQLAGHSTLALPYAERRAVLADLGLDGPRVRTPPWFAGGGPAVLAASVEQGLEGVLAKRLASPYQPGRRSPYWRKVKNLRTQEVVIGGWHPGAGRRAGMIGSLLLGVPAAEGLRYAGRVGTGFTEVMLRELMRQLEPLAADACPFAGPVPREQARDARWVRPVLVGEVGYGQWTADGMLRHPVWRGLRPDKAPGDVVIEG
jgi:bifunctional non-homologous end joining protein LigD